MRRHIHVHCCNLFMALGKVLQSISAYNMVACRVTDSRNGGSTPADSQVPLKKWVAIIQPSLELINNSTVNTNQKYYQSSRRNASKKLFSINSCLPNGQKIFETNCFRKSQKTVRLGYLLDGPVVWLPGCFLDNLIWNRHLTCQIITLQSVKLLSSLSNCLSRNVDSF